MSGLHLYCVVPLGVAPPIGLEGVEGAPVRAEPLGSLSLWVSAHVARPEPALAHVREHHDVVSAAAALDAALPVRFGEWAHDLEGLRAGTGRRHAELEAALRSVRGCVEYGVSVVEASVPRPSSQPHDLLPTPPSGPGRAYLSGLAGVRAQRRRRTARKSEVARALAEDVGAFVRNGRVEGVRPPGLLRAAHLVPTASQDAYRAALGAFERAHPEMEVHVVGPWPPYSFAP